MSANNYISIRKEGNHYAVRERDDDSDGEITNLGDFSKLEMAIQEANEYMGNEMVEYGLRIQL